MILKAKCLGWIIFAVSFAHAESLTVNYGDHIPDFLQTDVGSYGKDGGSQYCAPAAVSNSLMWLSSQGRTSLTNPFKTQRELVLELASPKYLATDRYDGTPPRILLAGLDRFLQDMQLSGAILEFYGIGPHPNNYSLGRDLPSPKLIIESDLKRSALWLNIGWIKKRDTNTYQRIGAHWVTVVGYGLGVNGTYSIAIHNPSPHAGKSKKTDIIRLTPIELGQLLDREGSIIQGANSGYAVEGLPSKRGDGAILAGIVRLRFST